MMLIDAPQSPIFDFRFRSGHIVRKVSKMAVFRGFWQFSQKRLQRF